MRKLVLFVVLLVALTGCSQREVTIDGSEKLEQAVAGAIDVTQLAEAVHDIHVETAQEDPVMVYNYGVASDIHVKTAQDPERVYNYGVASDIAHDEVTIAMEYFGTSYVSPSELFAELGEINEWLDQESFDGLGELVNNFSVAGFERMVASGEGDARYHVSGVVLCKMLSLPFDQLWENGFMSCDVVQSVIDQFGMVG